MVINIDSFIGNFELIPSAREEMPQVIEKFKGRTPTIEQYIAYLDLDDNYGNVISQELAELCQLQNPKVSQSDFERYQALYIQQKERVESQIPYLKTHNYRFLRLDDPSMLFSDVFRTMLGDAIQSANHLADARVFEVFNEDESLMSQTLVTREGNEISFGRMNLIAGGLTEYFEGEVPNIYASMAQAYFCAAKELIEISECKVAKYRREKENEIKTMGISEEEKVERIEKLRAMCEESSISRVVMNLDDSNIMLRDALEKLGVEIEVDADSGRSCAILSKSNFGVSKNASAQSVVRYRDKREVIHEEGSEISPRTIDKIRIIEKEAHKKFMRIYEENKVVNGEDLAWISDVSLENLRVFVGEDWYCVYSVDEEEGISVMNLAHGTPRLPGERTKGAAEIGDAIISILEKAYYEDLSVNADLREDTSYLMLLRLKKLGMVEFISDDNTYTWGENQEEVIGVVSEEEQMKLLKNRRRVAREGRNSDQVIMHQIEFKPTEAFMKRKEKSLYSSQDEI